MGNDKNAWEWETNASIDGAELRPEREDMLPSARIFMVGFAMGKGKEMTTAEIVEFARYKNWEGAERMMEKACRNTPIYKDDDGKWKECE
jgi:hypothetical protein